MNALLLWVSTPSLFKGAVATGIVAVVLHSTGLTPAMIYEGLPVHFTVAVRRREGAAGDGDGVEALTVAPHLLPDAQLNCGGVAAQSY